MKLLLFILPPVALIGVDHLLRVGIIAVGVVAFIIGFWRWRKPFNVVCRLKGLTWTREDFCRGWFISGATGSGKTASGIRQLLFQLFKHQPDFGGVCIDAKGSLIETLEVLADFFGM